MKTITTIPTLLLAAFAGCENGGVLETLEPSVGREIIEAFAGHVGEDPSDIRVREASWKDLRTSLPEIAEAIEEYVGEAGIAFPAWTEHDVEEAAHSWRAEGADPNTSLLVLMPQVPKVIHSIGRYGGLRYGPLPAIEIGYGGVRPGCGYLMPLERLEGGGWKVGEPEKDCYGFSSAMPWQLEDGKWVLDPR